MQHEVGWNCHKIQWKTERFSIMHLKVFRFEVRFGASAFPLFEAQTEYTEDKEEFNTKRVNFYSLQWTQKAWSCLSSYMKACSLVWSFELLNKTNSLHLLSKTFFLVWKPVHFWHLVISGGRSIRILYLSNSQMIKATLPLGMHRINRAEIAKKALSMFSLIG